MPNANPKVSILMVDDRPTNLLTLEAVLEDLNENLVRANSGAEALERLNPADCAVVLLDVQMPEMDGYEVAHRIRARDEAKRVPIIFMTAGATDEEQVARSYALGAIDHLTKPFSPLILRAKVQALVDLKRETLRAEARASRILESITDAFFAVNREWRFTYVNAQAEVYFRLPREEILDRHLWDDFPTGRGTQFEREFRGAMETGRAAHFEAFSRLRSLWVEVHAYPSSEGLAVYFRDITERKEADFKKDGFLAMLGHELRNPIGSISNAARLLRRRGNDPERLPGYVATIERQVAELSRLVGDIQDISRMRTGKLLLHREPVSLRTVVGGAVEAVSPLVQERQHRLHMSLPDVDLWVFGDRERLQQVVFNLLSNAAKYTRDPGEIWVTMERREERATVRVRDTGIGIPPEALPTLFDLFEQVPRTLGESREGLGLGLCLVRGLVEMHEGTVTACSEGPGKGAELTVTLPLCRTPEFTAQEVAADGG